MIHAIGGSDFYAYLSSTIPDDENVYRVAGKIDLLFSVGGVEFYNYYQINLAQTGITQGQSLPIYTNVENGLGIFSSRAFNNNYNIDIDSKTIDSLSCMTTTAHLNFLNGAGLPCH